MNKPPLARVEVVRETHFGTPVEDPYRWMEDWKGEELQSWVKAQAAYSRDYLEKLPHWAELYERIKGLTSTSTLLYNLKIAGGRSFYLRRDPGDNLPKLVVRMAAQAEETVLLDTNGLEDAQGAHSAIDWFEPSLDGRLLTYGLSQGGSEESTLYLMEVDTRRDLGLAISRVRFGAVSWLKGNTAFLYHRFPALAADQSPIEKFMDSQTFLHRLGDDPESDPAVFGRGLDPAVEIAREDFPLVVSTPLSDWAIGLILHGVLNEYTLYASPDLLHLDDPTNCHWIKVADVEDAVTGFAVRDETAYLLTHKDAPRYRVVVTSLSQPDLAQAREIVPQSGSVIQDLLLAGDSLLVRDLDAGIGRVRRVGPDGTVQNVELPFDGTITEWANEPGGQEVFLKMTGWTVSPRVYRLETTSGQLEDTGWLKPSPLDFSDIEAHEVFAPAADGTLIPLSLIHRKGLTLDGQNPTLITAYGSYGISLSPNFVPSLLAWVERGGVSAVAHVRGGGEYGQEWHEAGRKLTKQNTISDFVACAEYLVAQGYTRPEWLAGEGTSAGGIPSGGALVQRPDLWAAMVMRVAVLDSLRTEFEENGPPNIPEFGTITTEEGFRGLWQMDAYSKVRNGVKYPAALITTGMNDPRVVVWQASKMAARLQAATTSERPILLRVEFQGGHGMGATKEQTDGELADKFAFLLDQFGL